MDEVANVDAVLHQDGLVQAELGPECLELIGGKGGAGAVSIVDGVARRGMQQEEQQGDNEEYGYRDRKEAQDDEADDTPVGGVKPHGGERWFEGPWNDWHVPPTGLGSRS